MYLPAGWTPRPEQERLYHAVKEELDKGKRFVMVDAATGIGKSAIARALLDVYGTGIVITATKQLQQQYMRDFPEMPQLIGRGNFECILGKMTCDGGYYKQNPRKKRNTYCPNCPYQEHIQEAMASDFYVANYSSALWTAAADNGRGLLIIDEGHRTETELLQNLNVHINQKWWEKLDLAPPDDPDDEDGLFAWAEDFLIALKEQKNRMPAKSEVDRLYKSVQYLINHREELAWVAQAQLYNFYDNYIEFKPLRLSRYESARLLNKCERVVIMSATILNPEEMARNLGMKDEEWSYVYSKEAFDPATRPVHYIEHSLPITRETMDEGLEWLTDAIQMIMEDHENEKGLVHTSSTKIARHLKEHLNDPEERILLAHGKGRELAYKMHMRRQDPTILISPSMTEGVDLKGDLARFIVIAKCPYMSLGDKQTRQRAAIDREWYIMHTIRQIIQAAGRGTRSAEDYSQTYVLDAKVSEVLEEYAHIVPDWFWEAWESVG